MNLITQKSLGYVLEILKFLYFGLELEQEMNIKRLASDETRDQFLAALDFIIDRNMTHLGAFQIRFTDQSRTAIKKVPHLYAEGVEGYNDNKHVLPFSFRSNDKGLPLVVAEKYEKLFEYGNEKKITP